MIRRRRGGTFVPPSADTISELLPEFARVQYPDRLKPPTGNPNANLPASGATEELKATGKRKREETPEKSSKKLKAAENLPEPNPSKDGVAEDSKEQPELEFCPMCGEEYDPEDEDDDRPCEFHPGEMVVDRKSLTWKSELGVDPYDDEEMRKLDLDDISECYSDAFMWDCCECWHGAPGCETRSGHGEY